MSAVLLTSLTQMFLELLLDVSTNLVNIVWVRLCDENDYQGVLQVLLANIKHQSMFDQINIRANKSSNNIEGFINLYYLAHIV